MKIIIFAAAFLFGMQHLNAQTNSETKTVKPFIQRAQKWSVSAAISETKNVPIFSATGIDNSITKVYHPKYAIGIERAWKIKKGRRKYIGAELNYHNNYLVDRAIGLNLNAALEHKIYKGIYFGYGMGFGFAKAKRADLVYQLENGIWQPKTYPGKWVYNRTLIRGNAEIGYRFSRIPVDLFVGSNLEAQIFYLKKDVPLSISQSPIKIGARWHVQAIQ
jgi:hypothetical protein